MSYPLLAMFRLDWAALILMMLMLAVGIVAVVWIAKRIRSPRIGVASIVGIVILVGLLIFVRTVRMESLENELQHDQIQHELQSRLRSTKNLLQKQQRLIDEQLVSYRGNPEEATAPPFAAASSDLGNAAALTKVPIAWYAEVDDKFEADVYPSSKLAAQALATRVVTIVEKLLPAGVAEPTVVELTRMEAEMHEGSIMLEAMADVLSRKWSKTKVLTEHSAPKSSVIHRTDDSAIGVELSVLRRSRRSPAPWSRSQSEIGGTIRIKTVGRNGSLSTSVKFVEKPWLADLDLFLSTRDGNSALVVRSNRLANSEQESRKQVLDSAANLLSEMIRPTVTTLRGRASNSIMAPFNARVRERLEHGDFVVDRFVQTLHPSYGDVWREAILLDVSEDQLMRLASKLSAQERQTVQEEFSGTAAIFLLLGVIVGLYLVLNLITRGYYRRSVATIVCLLATSGVFVILAVWAGL